MMLFSCVFGFLIGTISAIWVRFCAGVSFRKKRNPFSLCKSCSKWYLEIGCVHYFSCVRKCMDAVPFFWYEIWMSLGYGVLSLQIHQLYVYFIYTLWFTLLMMMAYHDWLTHFVPQDWLWFCGVMMLLMGRQPVQKVCLSLLVIVFPLWIYQHIHPQGIGKADVILIGECCCFFPLSKVYVVLLIACLLGCIHVIRCIKKEECFNTPFPFFPYLIAGIYLVLFL